MEVNGVAPPVGPGPGASVFMIDDDAQRDAADQHGAGCDRAHDVNVLKWMLSGSSLANGKSFLQGFPNSILPSLEETFVRWLDLPNFNRLQRRRFSYGKSIECLLAMIVRKGGQHRLQHVGAGDMHKAERSLPAPGMRQNVVQMINTVQTKRCVWIPRHALTTRMHQLKFQHIVIGRSVHVGRFSGTLSRG